MDKTNQTKPIEYNKEKSKEKDRENLKEYIRKEITKLLPEKHYFSTFKT